MIRTPPEIAKYVSDISKTKAHNKLWRQFILAILAGAFIAFACEGSNMAAFNLLTDTNTYGLGRVLSGVIFGTGLMMVLLAGGELFTGNTLMIIGVLDKQISVKSMLKNWLIVCIGNFLGSMLIVILMFYSGLFNAGGGLLGGATIKIATAKTSLSFGSALALGIMCNWLVCLAIWVSYSAKDTTGKILSVFFIIGLFVTSGFEHSIANMYYIPAGILAKTNLFWLEQANLTVAQLQNLNWLGLIKNLIPVTIGNIIGGSVLVGGMYWLIYNKN